MNKQLRAATVCAALVATFFAASLLLATPAHAAGVVGDGTPGSCTAAALGAALNGGGTVSFNCGGPATILVLSEMTIDQDTVIQGGGQITLTGGLATRLFRVAAPAALTLNDITLDSGYSPTADGGAILSSGTLTLSNVAIENSKAGPTFCGGALRSDGRTVITDSRFNKNSAGAGGGAICTGGTGGAALEIANSVFSENLAAGPTPDTALGGAILLQPAATLAAVGSKFLLNEADGGGALAISGTAAATLRAAGDDPDQGIVFLANSATNSGGAIYNLGRLAVSGGQFNGNTVPQNTIGAGYGGGIANMGVLAVDDTFLSANRGRFGGGIFVGGSLDNARADIQHVVFAQNAAAAFGGGLYTNNETTAITVTHSVFRRNSADSGGGLARFNAKLYLADSSLVENSAGSAGGGVYLAAGPAVGSSSYVKVRSVTISSNQVPNGQGGGVYSAGRVELYYSTIVSNTNGVYGVLGGNTRLRSTVLHNQGFADCAGDGSTEISNDAANHVSDSSCGATLLPAGDPQLGPLQDDGLYTTAYHVPLAGSPLINRGYSACPERDQRGAQRPDACDIGAVEYAGRVAEPPPPSRDLFLPVIVRPAQQP